MDFLYFPFFELLFANRSNDMDRPNDNAWDFDMNERILIDDWINRINYDKLGFLFSIMECMICSFYVRSC